MIERILDKKVPNCTTVMECELHALSVWPKTTVKIENTINMTDKDEFNAYTDIYMSYDQDGEECTFVIRKYSIYVDDLHILQIYKLGTTNTLIRQFELFQGVCS